MVRSAVPPVPVVSPVAAWVAVCVVVCGAVSTACSREPTQQEAAELVAPVLDKMPEGAQVIEMIAYNDVNDIYRVFFVPRADGTKPEMVRQTGLKLARLGDAQAKKGIKPYLQKLGDDHVAVIPAAFKIIVSHGFTEQRLVPGTTEMKEVVVRYQRQPWQPLLVNRTTRGGADLLSLPAHYYPPAFDGRPMVGYGATGKTLADARVNYRQTFNKPALAEVLEKQGILEDLPDAGPPTDGGPGAGPGGRMRRPGAGKQQPPSVLTPMQPRPPGPGGVQQAPKLKAPVKGKPGARPRKPGKQQASPPKPKTTP